MAQDFRIMAPDQVRAVTVTNVSQSVALDVNVVSAMFSATINIDPIVTVTSTVAAPVWVTGTVTAGELSATVTFPVAISSTFDLSSSQYQDLAIAQGLQGAAVQFNQGIGDATVWLSIDDVNFYRETLFDVTSQSFKATSTHTGMYIVPTVAGAKTLRTQWVGAGNCSGTLFVTYAPFTGHTSGSDQQTYISGAALITGSVTVGGQVTASITGAVTTAGDLYAVVGAGYLSSTQIAQVVINDTFPASLVNSGTWTTSSNGTSAWDTSGGVLNTFQVNRYDILRSTASFVTSGGPFGNWDYFYFETSARLSGTTSANNQVTVGFISGTGATHQNGAYFIYEPSANTLSMRLRSGSTTIQNTAISVTSSVFNGQFHTYKVLKSGSTYSWWYDNVEVSSALYTDLDNVPLFVWYDVNGVSGGTSLSATYATVVEAYTSTSLVYQNTADDRFYGKYIATLPASAHAGTVSLVEHQAAPLNVDLAGNLKITGSVTATGTVTAIVPVVPPPATNTFSSASVTSSPVTVAAANSSRIGLTVANRSLSFPVYVLMGSAASFNKFTARIPPNGYYEAPYGYTGIVTAATSGSQTVTVMIGEVTP